MILLTDKTTEQCKSTLDLNLARIVVSQDGQVLRQLARSVELLDEALRIARAASARLSVV